MTANLDYTSGEAAIAYIGEVPWHKEGNEMEPDSPLSDWITSAHVNYDVVDKPLYYRHDDAYVGIPTKKALIRDDVDELLSVVGINYKYPQPRDIAYFFQDLIEDLGFTMSTLGALDGGRRIWAFYVKKCYGFRTT